MTVTVPTNQITYTGNGVTDDFPFSFRVDDADWLIVTLITIATAVEDELDPSEYSVVGIGDDDGGTVTYPLVGSPIAATHQLKIERIVPLTQELSISNQDGFLPEVIEQALDKMTMMIQQADAKASEDVEVYAIAAANSAIQAADALSATQALVADLIANSAAILTGSGVPSALLGEDGFVYIDTTNWVIYGPKTAGAWGSGTSLVGPAGAGSGDVQGPASSTNNAVAIFNGTTGKLIANSGRVFGAANGAASLDASALVPVAQIPNLAQSKITNLTTDLGNKAARTQTRFLSGFIESPSNKDYVIILKAAAAITVTKLITQSTAGTCTLTGKIDGVNLGGTANAVSTSEVEQAHASANAVGVGTNLVLTVSANSGCANLAWRIEYTEVMAA